VKKRTTISFAAVAFTIAAVFVLQTIPDQSEGARKMQEGTTIDLPSPVPRSKTSVEEAIQQRRSVRTYANDPLTLQQVSQLLWAAQGITDTARGLRVAPSAGALYPLEIYLVAGNVRDLPDGVYHYKPKGHKLALTLKDNRRDALRNAALGQASLKDAPASIAIAADYSRTSSRYGERAARYVFMEAGHVGQNVALQAVALGLATVMIGAFDDDQVKKVLHLPKNEEALYIIPVGRKR